MGFCSLLVLASAYNHDKSLEQLIEDATVPKIPLDMTALEAAVAKSKKDEEQLDKAQKAVDALGDEPFSLLETGAPTAWSKADTAKTEALLGKSYGDMNRVQDEIIAAANQELKEQKSMPTLEQATHHWDASKFSSGQDVPATSLAQTGAAPDLEAEYASVVDFSKLDKLRAKVDGVGAAMQRDAADLKVQTSKDEAFAATLEASVQPHLAHEKLAALVERSHAQHAAHTGKGEHLSAAAAKLEAVQGKLGLLEQSMERKAASVGESPVEREMHHKLQELLALSRSARGLVAGVKSHEGKPEAAQLAELKRVQEGLLALKKTFHGHLHPAMSLVEKEPKQELGYAPIEKNLNALHDRIEQQVDALHKQAAEATAEQVSALNGPPADSSADYKFAWTQPDLQTENDNLRTH